MRVEIASRIKQHQEFTFVFQLKLVSFSVPPPTPIMTMSGSNLPVFEGQPVTFVCNAFTRSVPEELVPPFNYFWFIDGTRYRLNDSLPDGHRRNSTGRQLLVSGLTLNDNGRRYGCSVQEEHSEYESDRSEEETVVVRPMGNLTPEDWLRFRSECKSVQEYRTKVYLKR